MAATKKVGSWLDQAAAQEIAEAYDSSSDAESSKSVKPEQVEAVEVDWDELMPQLRSNLMDASKKRRDAFVSRNLRVTPDSPPAKHTPAILTTVLASLPLVYEPDHVDLLVSILTSLVKRDEQEKTLELGDKLVKWTTGEVDKVVSSSRTTTPTVHLPYLYTILGLLSTLRSRPDFSTSSQFTELVMSLATVVDVMESKSQGTGKVERLRKKTGIRTWRALRELRSSIPAIVDILVKTTTNPLRVSILLNHAISVALRLKPTGERKGAHPAGRQLLDQERIVAFYTANVIGSKTPVPRYISQSYSLFLSSFLDLQTLSEKLIPSAERMMLRAPEVALEITADMLLATSHDISPLLPGKLVPSILSAAKSSNAETRAKSITLFNAVVSRCDDPTRVKIATEVLALPKTGKTASVENRATLFTMASSIPASDTASVPILETLIPLIAKETNDAALSALAANLPTHLAHLLKSGITLPPAAVDAFAKELNSAKVPTRRALSMGLGDAVWAVREQLSKQGQETLAAFASSLETNLQSASANPASNPPGFVEGYVAAALAFGPLSTSKLAKSPALPALFVTSPKPSFLLNDKAYSKLPTDGDRKWFLRALQAAVLSNGPRVDPTTAGLAFIYLAFETKNSDCFTVITDLMQKEPRITGRIIHDGLVAWLRTDRGDETKSQHMSRLLHAVFNGDKAVLADLAVDFLVVAHHPEVSAEVSWITLVQGAGLDPATIAAEQSTRILESLWAAASAPPTDSQLAVAAYRAITTLTFVCPAIYVDAVLERIREDLHPHALDFVGAEERGIWITPEGQAFVDVLSTKKDAPENKNRKDYATEKWEQEVRESLKKKAATNVKLNKADQAAVNAQLAKESAVRARVASVQARLSRGVDLVAALVASNAEMMERHVGELATLLLNSVFGPGSFLIDNKAFSVFLSLGNLAADRLGENRRMIAAAILRSHDAPFIAEDYLQEPVGELVMRLLYQISFIAEQNPLNSTSFSIISLLLSRIAEQGGIDVESPTSEEAQTQLTLTVNIIAACCGEFQDDAYPRLETIRNLFTIIGHHSKLAKDAGSALVDLAAAIKDVATPQEISELISGTLSKDSNVRNSALQALQPVDLTDLDYSEELWIAAHDEDEQNANLANHLWDDNGLDIPETYLTSLLGYLAHDSAPVRLSCAAALADAAEHYPAQVEPTITGLQALYVEKSKPLDPEFDRFGMVIPETVNRADPFESRTAIALALHKMAPQISQSLVEPLFQFFISGALGDRHSAVRKTMLDAAVSVVDLHGAEAVTNLMKMFEDYLSAAHANDYINEAVVILFGRLARHLDSEDPRIPKVVDRLVDALNTPSELVQSAVADCLPPLVADMSDEVEYLVDKLFSTLTTGAKYASRRGAAYGLAGVVKGRGLVALKEYELLEKLQEAAEDKTAYQSRQGAVFAFETLSATLGRVFEPYIISIIPLLLTLFGDSNGDVREAVSDSARVIMSKVSGHCVKLMLPTLLGGLDEKQWRTKKGSIELLGAMAFCAPKQLSLSLPTIIPQLTGVINDSHAQVKSAANTSLKRFGEVLSNPEIKAIQSTLMKALADPSAKTNAALAALLKTTFEHYLDAPSLALVMPIIDRGLRQRSSDIKRRSVQIVGNMASLTEARDLVPYLDSLMPLVHEVLVDPVPEARATAAKSLGTLIERLGENNFPNLVNELLQTLRSDTSGVDRQGAAQGLSEVLSGLGMERLEGLLPDIINNTGSPRPYVREGFISLLVYLPATFGHRFAPHLGRVVPPILNGLADDSEYVREASMRAGKMIIANYSSKAIDLLLPELEKGMIDASWRIRQSSIALTGELLYKVTGISGKVELEEEDAPAQSADTARKALLDALGQDRRDRVLATLYIVRQDSVGIVRQASIHIWKALVQNTPRTTREILPVLMQLIMSLLGSPEVEQQETASRTLGELCRKNGERIFGEIMPILQKAITSPDERTKEGACLAFSDVMAASSKDVIADYDDTIISAVRVALVDSSAVVRSAAAKTFDTMQHYMGAKAIDQTIPTLLEAMRNPGESSETALQALKEVMSVRANSVFPVLIPTLIVQPITAFNARALGALVQVAGSALNRRLDTVLGALVQSLEKEKSEDVLAELNSAVEALLSSVQDSDGIHLLEMLLFAWAKDVNPVRRATACGVFGTMCQVNDADTSEYRVDWIRILVSLFDDRVEEVVTAAWEALEQFVKTVPKDELEELVVPLRRTIESTGSPGRHVPGFSRPKGAQSIVPILLAGILGGTQEQREQAALAIGDLVQRTSEAAIKPYIIQLTGPLIRVISGQTIAPQIKSAILTTLTVLLEEVPQLVKPFHPQLTRTFVKSASDPAAASVRTRAAAGLGELMKHQPRVDPLITELVGSVKTVEKDVSASVAQALGAVCASAAKSIGPAAKASIVDLVEEAFSENRGESYNTAMGKIVAGLAKNDPLDIRSICDDFLAAPTPPTAIVSIVIMTIMEDAPEAFLELDIVEDVLKKVQASVGSDSSAIARPAREAREIIKSNSKWQEDKTVQAILK